MVFSISPRLDKPLNCGAFEKIVTDRLNDALASGCIVKFKYLNLCSELEWVLPSSEHQEAFLIHLNNEINPNVQPSYLNVQPSGTTSAAASPSDSASSGLIAGSQAACDRPGDDISPSPIPNHQSVQSHQQFTVPAFEPITNPAPGSTAVPTSNDGCSSSVPCCEPASIVQSPPADINKLAQSSSSNLPDQCRRPKSNWRLIAVGDRKFKLPPLQSSVQLSPQLSDRTDPPPRTSQPNLNSKPTSQVQNPQPENHVECNTKPVQNPSASSSLMSDTSSSLTNLSPTSLLDSQRYSHMLSSPAANAVSEELSTALLLNPRCGDQPKGQICQSSKLISNGTSHPNQTSSHPPNIYQIPLQKSIAEPANINQISEASSLHIASSSEPHIETCPVRHLLTSSAAVNHFPIYHYGSNHSGISRVRNIEGFVTEIDPEPPPKSVFQFFASMLQITCECLYRGSNSTAWYKSIESLFGHELDIQTSSTVGVILRNCQQWYREQRTWPRTAFNHW